MAGVALWKKCAILRKFYEDASNPWFGKPTHIAQIKICGKLTNSGSFYAIFPHNKTNFTSKTHVRPNKKKYEEKY